MGRGERRRGEKVGGALLCGGQETYRRVADVWSSAWWCLTWRGSTEGKGASTPYYHINIITEARPILLHATGTLSRCLAVVYVGFRKGGEKGHVDVVRARHVDPAGGALQQGERWMWEEGEEEEEEKVMRTQNFFFFFIEKLEGLVENPTERARSFCACSGSGQRKGRLASVSIRYVIRGRRWRDSWLHALLAGQVLTHNQILHDCDVCSFIFFFYCFSFHPPFPIFLTADGRCTCVNSRSRAGAVARPAPALDRSGRASTTTRARGTPQRMHSSTPRPPASLVSLAVSSPPVDYKHLRRLRSPGVLVCCSRERPQPVSHLRRRSLPYPNLHLPHSRFCRRARSPSCHPLARLFFSQQPWETSLVSLQALSARSDSRIAPAGPRQVSVAPSRHQTHPAAAACRVSGASVCSGSAEQGAWRRPQPRIPAARNGLCDVSRLTHATRLHQHFQCRFQDL